MITLAHLFVLGSLTVWPVTHGSLPASFSLAAASPAAASAVDPGAGVPTAFNVPDSIQVPGKTLPAGEYTIRIVDHLSDRMIVRVERKGKAQATFLALPKSALDSSSGQGPIRLSSGKNAMRGFVFPDGTVAEFVYPKAEAVELAKRNGTTIPAVDPASEGRPDTSSLSSDDMQMVTLWMLSPTLVKPGQSGGPGIAAAKYKAPAQPVEVASETTPARLRPQSRPQPRPQNRPVLNVLPHTAGELPLVALAGLLSLTAAGWMTRRRLTR